MTPNEKIDRTYEMVYELKTVMAKHVAYQENHSDILKEHKDKIEVLEAHKNKTVGIGSVLGLIAGTLGAWIIKHF